MFDAIPDTAIGSSTFSWSAADRGTLSLSAGIVQSVRKVKEMAKRTDSPLGGMLSKEERQRLEREGKRKLDRVAQAFEKRARSRDRSDRRWVGALTIGAPFPRRRD